MEKDDDDEAFSYFTQILPKIKEKEAEHLREIEFIQYPGFLLIFIAFFVVFMSLFFNKPLQIT